MRNRETVFDTYEHEYAVAGWLGTIGVMQCIGSTELDRVKQFAGADKYVVDLCGILAKQETSLAEEIEFWLAGRNETEEQVALLAKLGIVIGGQITTPFKDAYDIHENPEFRQWLESQTDFSRLTGAIDDVTNHYSQLTIAGLNSTVSTHRKGEPYYLESTLPTVIRDTCFYVGLYDPARQLPYQQNQTR